MNLNLPTKYMYADTIITKCPHIKEVPYFSGIVQYTCAFNILAIGQQAELCLIRDQGALTLELPLHVMYVT